MSCAFIFALLRISSLFSFSCIFFRVLCSWFSMSFYTVITQKSITCYSFTFCLFEYTFTFEISIEAFSHVLRLNL